MAPNPLCLVWREQIIDNLRLISGRSAVIDVYTSRHPNKSFTIYAVKVHRGKRQEVLSATGRDLEDAFENLHTKSSQEVYQFIDANGFAFPRGVKAISGHRDDDGSETSGSEASTVDTSDVTSDASSGSEDDNVRRGKKTKSSSRRKSKRKSKKHSKHRDSSSSSEEEEEEESDSEPEIAPRRRPAAVVPVTRPSYIPATHIPGSYPPPPPPGWRGPPTRVHPRAPAAGMPPPPPTFPPGMRPPQHHQGLAAPAVPGVPPAPSKPVRLVVRWRGHGEKKIIENCAPSHRALQRAALAHVRSQWQTFENVLAQEMTPGRLWGLGAKVRRAALGEDMYAISAAGGDDLGVYFKAEDIPMFEIDVDHDGSIMPPPPPPHHPHH